jgi:transcriptional regulator with XRE-family HTH domain
LPGECMPRGHFDSDAFYAAIDAVRISKDWTWKKVAKTAGVSASTLTRMAQGKRPDVDSLAALAEWSELDLNDYLHSERPPEGFGGQALERMTALFRADPNLTPAAVTAIETTLKVLYQELRKKTPNEATPRLQD